MSKRETMTPVPMGSLGLLKHIETQVKLTDRKMFRPLLSDILAQECLQCRDSSTALVDGSLNIE
jgi:hypothetical protein